MTRDELQRSEAPKFAAQRSWIADQLGDADSDPYVVGLSNFSTALSWIALHRDIEGARDFLDAAAVFLERERARCTGASVEAGALRDCATTHLREFVVYQLMDHGRDRWLLFDAGLALLARALDAAPPTDSAAPTDPLVLRAAGLAALGTLHHRELPSTLVEVARTAPVSPRFRPLRDTLTAVIELPDASRCAAVRQEYRARFPIVAYRPPHLGEFSLEELLPVSAVAQGGDVRRGAVELFE